MMDADEDRWARLVGQIRFAHGWVLHPAVRTELRQPRLVGWVAWALTLQSLHYASTHVMTDHHRYNNHVLHKFMPSQSEAFEHYDLRQRRHNFSLPARTSHLADNNFIQRTLYHDVYWLCTFNSVHLLYIYMMLRFVGTLINTHDDDFSSPSIEQPVRCVCLCPEVK